MATYYVATDGVDQDPPTGGTFENPWRTSYFAASKVSAGDTVYFRAGTYQAKYSYNASECVNVTTSGTEENPITFAAYQDGGNFEEVWFDGQENNDWIVTISSRNWWTFDGIHMKDARYGGVIAENGCEGIVVKRCKITNVGALASAGCVYFKQASNSKVQYCELYEASTGVYVGYQGIASGQAGSNNLVEWCLIRDNDLRTNSSDGITWRTSTNGIIRNCVFLGNYEDGIDCGGHGLDGLLIQDVVCAGGGLEYEDYGNGIKIGQSGTTPAPTGTVVKRAIIFNNYGQGIQGSGNEIGHTIYNSIIWRNREFGIVLNAGQLCNFKNNVACYNNPDDAGGDGSHDIADSGSATAMNDSDYNCIEDTQDYNDLQGDGHDGNSINAAASFDSAPAALTGTYATDRAAIEAAIDLNIWTGGNWTTRTPNTDFGKVAGFVASGADANIVNAGVDVGEEYQGAAPDIGAYEWTEAGSASGTVAVCRAGMAGMRGMLTGV